LVLLGLAACATEPARLIAPGERKPVPDAVFTDVFSGEPVKLSAFEGQVILLEFWATWCRFCQGPMTHDNKIMAKRKKGWAGKAVIVGASIDDNAEAVRRHVQSKGWQSIRHLWCTEGGTGRGSSAARAYGISGVPTAFLIDRTGRIAWRGHPDGIDVESEIDRLVKQDKEARGD